MKGPQFSALLGLLALPEDSLVLVPHVPRCALLEEARQEAVRRLTHDGKLQPFRAVQRMTRRERERNQRQTRRGDRKWRLAGRGANRTTRRASYFSTSRFSLKLLRQALLYIRSMWANTPVFWPAAVFLYGKAGSVHCLIPVVIHLVG